LHGLGAVQVLSKIRNKNTVIPSVPHFASNRELSAAIKKGKIKRRDNKFATVPSPDSGMKTVNRKMEELIKGVEANTLSDF
jgi:hypothetical protein